MSLDLIRDDLLDAKTTEITSCLEAHQQKLRALYRLTKFVANPPNFSDFSFAAPPTPEEERFLDGHDLAKGRTFEDASLPFPSKAATLPSIKSRPSPLPPVTHAPSPLSPAPDAFSKVEGVERLSTPAIQKPAIPSIATPPVNTQTPPRSPSSVHKDDRTLTIDVSGPAQREQRTPAAASPTVRPQADLPLTDDDAAHLEEQEVSSTVTHQERPAKVVHLPPREEQVQHIRDLEKAEEAARRRESEEDAAASLSAALPTAEVGSSPSSAAGAASTATPKPPTRPSPDTSPDVEAPPAVQPEGVHLPTPDAARTELQKSTEPPTSDEDASATSPTPDAQLLQESTEASKAPSSQVASAETMQVDNAAAAAPLTEATVKEAPKINGVIRQPARPQGLRRTSSFVKSSKELLPQKRAPSDAQDVVMEDRPLSPIATPMATRPPRPSVGEATAQRMTTRVASGAIRQKSVSEILGGPPKPAQPERTPSSQALVPSRAGRRDFPQTPSEERTKHSMVVFSKTLELCRPNLEDESDGYLALKGASLDANRDYMKPLFINQAYQLPRALPLQELMTRSGKIVTTSNIQAIIREQGDYKILRRIYQLQNANKWSLRQMAKFPDPRPPVTHQDHLLKEMKWMRTDFREERRWKMAVARNLAEWCALYVAASDEVKQHLRVKAKPPPMESAQPMEIADSFDSTPPLEHSGSTPSDHSLPDELPLTPDVPSTPPTALFGLGYDDLTFQMDPTPAADSVLNELPIYELKLQSSIPTEPKSVIPVSKFAVGKLVPTPATAPKKRSRYHYEEEESDSSGSNARKRRNSDLSLFMSPSRRSSRVKELPPEETDVALFNPVNRHIRERLHAAHAFRPPSEFLMPSTLFFECRVPSQWTWEEDQKLRKSVKEYSYNWSIISMEMSRFTQPSRLVSGVERRTPWECFERWVQLEGLPNDMGKTQYFRTYSQRLEAANKAVQAQRAQQAQQQVQTPNQMPQSRLKGTSPFRVERRRDGRHITMIDAIRKIVRKRESQAHRQQEAAKAAALRKQQANPENNPQRASNIHTPAEFSRMKYEREQKMHERQEQYRRQMLEQQQKTAQLQQRSALGLQQGMANMAAQQQRNGTPNNAQGPSPQSAQMGPSPPNAPLRGGHPVQGMMQNGLTNGAPNGIPAGMPIPQAQMQGMQGQQRLPGNVTQEQMRIAMQQRQLAAAQNQQFGMHHGGQPNSLAAAHLSPANGAMQNPQMLAAIAAQQRANGMVNGMAQGNSTSPRGPHPNMNPHRPHQLSSGVMPSITYYQQKVQAEYPHFTPDQVMKLAQEQLKGQLQKLTANAATAAAGMPAMMNNPMAQMNINAFAQNGMNGNHSPQQFQAQLHRQMQQQQARMSGSPGIGAAQPRPASRSATPQGPQMQAGNMMHQRSGSGAGSMGPDLSESPRLPTAQMTRP